MFAFLTAAFVALAVFATSALSGVFGMAGGLVLLAILLAMLPVATAIAVQGAIQIVANGSRAWFSRAHIDWRVLGVICTGSRLQVWCSTPCAIRPTLPWSASSSG
jgi:uncharacterized membrane protein YfcA